MSDDGDTRPRKTLPENVIRQYQESKQANENYYSQQKFWRWVGVIVVCFFVSKLADLLLLGQPVQELPSYDYHLMTAQEVLMIKIPLLTSVVVMSWLGFHKLDNK
jgi:hypothetical protein